MFNINPLLIDSLYKFLLHVIFNELEKGKEIAYYNSAFGIGGYAQKCIFC